MIEKNKLKNLIDIKTHKNTYIGLFSILSFWLALYVFGYYFNYKDYDFFPKNSSESEKQDDINKDYTISCSLSGGNKAGMTIFFSLGILTLLYLVNSQLNKITKYISFIIILIVFALLLSMIYYNPFEEDTKYRSTMSEHGNVATFAFTLALIFNLIILYLASKKYNRWVFYSLMFIQLAFFLSLVGAGYYEMEHINTPGDKRTASKTVQDYFPVAENISFNFFVLSIFFLTFLNLRK